MPRRRDVSTLRRLCSSSIACGFEQEWCSAKEAEALSRDNVLYVLGPFQSYPSDVINEIANALRERSLLRRHHTQLLVHSNLHTLDLTLFKNTANESFLVQLVSQRCQKLKNLTMSGFCKASRKTMVDLLCRLTKLTALNVSDTGFDDQMLHIVASYLPCLQSLLADRTKVSDAGLTMFANEVEGVCMLRHLAIEACAVDGSGLQHVLNSTDFVSYRGPSFLRTLPLSKQLNHLCQLTVDCDEFGAESDPDAVEQAFSLLPSAVPALQKVEIGGRVSNLSFVAALSQLKVLYIWELGDADQLINVLTVCGAQLTVLAINYVDSIDLSALACLCPNVQHVSVGMGEHPRSGEEATSHWSKLSRLELKIDADTASSAVPASLLLSTLHQCEDLHSVHFCNVSTVDDQLLLGLLNLCQQLPWEEVVLESCDNVTASSLFPLVAHCPRLQKLTSLHCKQVMLRDHQALVTEYPPHLFNVIFHWK